MGLGPAASERLIDTAKKIISGVARGARRGGFSLPRAREGCIYGVSCFLVYRVMQKNLF